MTEGHENLEDVLNRQLGAFSNVDTTDSRDFIERLDAMHALEFFRAYKRVTFDLMRLSPGAAVADLGCGTGEDAKELAALTGESGSVTGLDLSEAMIETSRARHGGVTGLSYKTSSVEAIDLPDASLDAIRADRVLIHVPDPERAVDEMVRVLKPGGRIVLSEPDMPGFWVAANDYALTDTIARAIAGSCAHPYLARDLYALLRDRGMDEVDLVANTITSFELAAAAKVLNFEVVLKLMVSKGMMSQQQAIDWSNDVLERASTGRFVAGLTIMIAHATKR